MEILSANSLVDSDGGMFMAPDTCALDTGNGIFAEEPIPSSAILQKFVRLSRYRLHRNSTAPMCLVAENPASAVPG
jgi:hypothetical protein